MKLLIFSPYYPPHIGGLESHAQEFNQQLVKKGYRIIVFTPQLPANSLSLEWKHKHHLKIIRFPAWEIISNYPLPKFWSLKFWQLFFQLYSENPSIVISRTRFFITSLLALFYAKTKRKKWIHIEHGSDFVQLSSKFKNLIAKFYDYTLGWLIFKCSDLNIAISQAVAEFIKKFDKRPSIVIPRGINLKKIKEIAPDPKIKKKYKDYLIIGFIGRLIDTKAVHNLILAFQKITRSFPQKLIVLYIIGEGPQRKKLEKLARKLKLENKIIFTGNLNNQQAISYMKNFDIFINPSHTEGLPTSVLEAGLCQNAIIATNVGGTSEIIQHNVSGYLIRPNSSSAIAEKIIDLIKNPDKIKLFGKKAQKQIQQNFSWQKSTQKYETEFKKLSI